MNKLPLLKITVFALVLLGLTSCSPAATVKKRAVFDLDCPEEKIQVSEISYHIWGATGCEKKVSYLAGCGLFWSCMAIIEGTPAANAALRNSSHK